MGVQVATGRGRRTNAELNLVPFIDLLSVCITFLIATAVWVEVHSLPVDQAIGGSGPATDAPPPLTVALAGDGIRVFRDPTDVAAVPRAGAGFAWGELDAALARDRAAHPDDDRVVVGTADGLPYGDMVRALDHTRAWGYEQTLLSSTPATRP